MLASKCTKSFLHRLTCQTSRCTGLELLINSQNLCLLGMEQMNFIVTTRSALYIGDMGRLEVVEKLGRADKNVFKLDRAGKVKVNLRLTGSMLTKQEALASSVSDDRDGRCSDEKHMEAATSCRLAQAMLPSKRTTEEGFKKVPLLRDNVRLVNTSVLKLF